ncbi:MAG TPA: right-handed parallel beta-helix repeat-containing protein [Rhodanobacteraceae bacterium]|nr:right-handed parallel beta-helix repeat-containing protein [Rhodanobacteraceae bacterium]
MKVLHLSAAAMLAWGGFAAFNVASATTYYVRTDGGTAVQCNGTADKAYPGSGTNMSCAWNHPFVALPPTTSNHPMATRIHGGDTLVIDPGSYEMGIGAKDATKLYGACTATYPWDCEMPAIPSGTASNPTRIVGAGWNTGCKSQPELWGSNRPYHVMNLDNSSNVVVACLNLTDHSACIYNDSNVSLTCNKSTPPYGPWAPLGIHAQDSNNVTLQDLRIHGFASTGIQAGRLSNWTLTRVQIIANGRAGWNGDLGSTQGSSNSGNMTFNNVEVAWTGCAEKYPYSTIYGCWGQIEGGYGDGIGTAATGGNWTYNQVSVHDNTQDGLDMRYANGTGKVTVLRSHFYNNAGNQVKIKGPAVIQNSVIVGYCSAFNGKYDMSGGDNCRANGTAVLLVSTPGALASLSYNTIISQGDCVITNQEGSSASEMDLYDNVLIGQPSFRSPDQKACLYWWEKNPPIGKVAVKGNVIWNTRFFTSYPAGNTLADPKLKSESLATFDPTPLSGSPAIDKASTVLTVKSDYAGYARPVGAGYDIGSREFGSTQLVGQPTPPPTNPTPPPTNPPPPPTTRKYSTGGALPARLIGSSGTSSASEPARSVSSEQAPVQKTSSTSTSTQREVSWTEALRRWLRGEATASR